MIEMTSDITIGRFHLWQISIARRYNPSIYEMLDLIVYTGEPYMKFENYAAPRRKSETSFGGGGEESLTAITNKDSFGVAHAGSV